MSSLVWRDPPAHRRGNPRSHIRAKEVDDLAQELRENPGRWAVVEENRPTRGNTETYSKRGLEVAQRKSKNGMYSIYARQPVA